MFCRKGDNETQSKGKSTEASDETPNAFDILMRRENLVDKARW